MANNTHDIHVEVRADAKNVSREMHKVVEAVKDVGNVAQQSDKGLADINKALQNMIGYAQASNNHLKNLNIQMKNLGNASRSAAGGMKNVAAGAESAGEVLNKVATAVKGFVAVQAAVKIAELGASCVQSGMQITKLKNSLEVLTGSAEKGQQTFQEFAKFAAETPFDTKEVIEYGKQMIAQGYAVNEVTKYLRVFGDTAAATGTDLGGVTLVMGQIRNSSKLMLQDVMQLQNRGVNVWQMLADASGKSMAEMKEAVHDGTVSGAQAFEMLSGQMEKTFGGMMDKQAQSLEGAINELGETVENVKAEFGEWLAEALKLKDGIKSLTNGLKDMLGQTEENRKADTNLRNVQAAVQKAIDDTTYVLKDLEDELGRGIISSKEFSEKEASIREGAEIAQNGINQVNNAVGSLNNMMNKGIITAGDYANALASIAMAQSKMGAISQQMQSAILSGNQEAVNNLKVEMASVAAEIAYEVKQAKALGDHYSNYGQDGSGGVKTITGLTESKKKGGSKENAALKAAQEEDKINQERLKIENEYVRLKLRKEKDLFTAQNAIAKEFGTKQQKLAIALSEIEFAKRQQIEEEELAYKEQILAIENAMKEAALKTNGQKEIDMLKEKLALLKETHQYTLNNIKETAKNSADATQMEYSNGQMAWQSKFNTGSTVDRMTMSNERDREIAQAKADRETEDAKKLEILDEMNRKYDQQKDKIETISKIQQLGNSLAHDFAGAMTDWITGAESFGDAMKNVLKSLISQLIQAAIYATIVASVTGGGGGFAARWSKAFGKGLATGGPVSGPGTSTSDSIPCMLSDGEYVLSAQTTKALGVPFLNGLNTGKLAGFSVGGLVGGYKAETSVGRGNTVAGGSVTLNVSTLSADSFRDFLSRDGIGAVMDSMAASERMFNNGVWK